MKILYLTRWFPFPPDNGIKQRIFHLIKQLKSKGFEIDLFVFSNKTISKEQQEEAKKTVGQLWIRQFREFESYDFKALLGYFSRKPRSLFYAFDSGADEEIKEICSRRPYDWVIHSEMDTILYAKDKNLKCKHLLEDLEITSFFESKEHKNPIKQLFRIFRQWKMKKFLQSEIQFYDLITAVSEQEKDLIKSIAGAEVLVVPNSVSPPDSNIILPVREKTRNLIIYPGSINFKPNYLAVKYFIDQVMPLLRDSKPEVEFQVTGAYNGEKIQEFQRDGIIFTGYVENIQHSISKAWLCAAPIYHGSGTRLKILESIICGTPVISSTKGAEGLDKLRHGSDIYLEDEPQKFASRILELMNNDVLYESVRSSGCQRVIENYSWAQTGELLAENL